MYNVDQHTVICTLSPKHGAPWQISFTKDSIDHILLQIELIFRTALVFKNYEWLTRVLMPATELGDFFRIGIPIKICDNSSLATTSNEIAKNVVPLRHLPVIKYTRLPLLTLNLLSHRNS